MVNHKITIEKIGKDFASNGYIQTDTGIMQYNITDDAFDFVSDNEVLDIFRRVYPNFERRVLKVGMITQYLPYISNEEFTVFIRVGEVLNRKLILPIERINEITADIIKKNENRKKPVADTISITDYDSFTQYLINNDIYYGTDSLYQYKDNTFKYFGIYQVQNLLNDVTFDKLSVGETARIIHMTEWDLTDINDIIVDIKIMEEKEALTNEDTRIYANIKGMINKFKEYAEQ